MLTVLIVNRELIIDMCSPGLRKIVISTPVQLYRHLCRRLRQLPEPIQGHYKHQIRQSFKSHRDETDPVRIQQIISRAIEDTEWVVKKYSQHSP